MNILILNWRDTQNPKSGGAEIVTMMHAKAWVSAGHTVTWFTSKFPRAKREEIHDGVRIVRRGNSLTTIFHAPFFYLFGGGQFDIVIDEIHGLPFFTPLYVRKPIIAFIHEIAGEIWDYMYPFPLSKIGKILESVYFLFYRHIPFWTDAESTIDELVIHGIERENCISIPCPTDMKALSNLPKKESDPTFIFISRLVKMKGIEEIIHCFLILRMAKYNAKLWIVGSGERKYVASLKRRAKRFGIAPYTTFFGSVSEQEKKELLSKAHLILHASVKEGWGLVIMEAASQATPAVVYDVPGLRDSVKNGKTGIVLDTNTPLRMAEEAMDLLKNDKRYTRYQKNALEWAKSLSWKKSCADSVSLLEEVHKKRNGRAII